LSYLTFEEAVHLFEQWGFEIEAGPRAEEVTLLLRSDESCTYSVQERRMLPQMAEVALAVRWRSGTVQAASPLDNQH